MICGVCYRMLRGHEGRQWRGTFDLQLLHHVSMDELENSAKLGCFICGPIFAEVQERPGVYGMIIGGIMKVLKLLPRRPWPERKQVTSSAQNIVTRAGISHVPARNGLYRLEFHSRNSNWIKVLVLKWLDEANVPLHTPIPGNTALDEIVHLTRKWIHRCEMSHPACDINPDHEGSWYPRRLIDLGASQSLQLFGKMPSETIVRLVLTHEWNQWTKTNRYFTLSHCWGQAQILRLTNANLDRFQQGINLDELPLTFRDAMLFASRLGIRYIWIDSLCIIQDNVQDWIDQSSAMHKVYNHSFCNLSATSARDSRDGLFFDRNTRPLWEAEVNVDTDGIPASVANPRGDATDDIPSDDESTSIKRCALIDPMFWEQSVDNAILNTRGWVLQERLMAPRVLHFCRDQIAWECQEEDAAECYPPGLSSLSLSEGKKGEVVSRSRMKGLNPDVDGRALREARAMREPVPDLVHLGPEVYAYELWKRIVEVYSKARLTKPKDKLVALAGLARLMSDKINSDYIAGMWEKHLASQLLWRVEPVFEKGLFSYPSKRSPEYRAPTFSWASVDSETGVAYGEVTDQGLLIHVKEVKVTPVSDVYGMLKDAYVLLTGTLQRIEIRELVINKSKRYGWEVRNFDLPNSQWVARYTNVYLDSPSDDPGMLGPDSEVYCLPVAWDESGRILNCLLLQLVEHKADEPSLFRRIGLSRVAKSETDRGDILDPREETRVPNFCWDERVGVHAIRII